MISSNTLGENDEEHTTMINAIRTQPARVSAPRITRESSGNGASLRPVEIARTQRHGSLTCRWMMVETSNGGAVLTACWVETAAVR